MKILFFNADEGRAHPLPVSIEGRGPCSHRVKLILSRLTDTRPSLRARPSARARRPHPPPGPGLAAPSPPSDPGGRRGGPGGRCPKCHTVAHWCHFGPRFGTLFFITFDDSSTKRRKRRSPKGVKSGYLGRVPAGAQAPDLQAPDFVAPLDKSVRVPGCLPI